MENCLVTKYKIATNNSNLDFFGKIQLDIETSAMIGLDAGLPIEVVATEGAFSVAEGNQTNIGTWFEHPSVRTYNITGGGKGYVLIPKYGLTKFFIQKPGYNKNLLEQLKYCDLSVLYLTLFNGPATFSKMEINISDIVEYFPNMAYMGLTGGIELKGSVSDLANLHSLVGVCCKSDNLTGKCSDIGNISTIKNIVYCNGINSENWSIEELVANQRSAGNTTGSINGANLADYEHMYFDNELVPTNTWNAGDKIISWTATTITAIGKTVTA